MPDSTLFTGSDETMEYLLTQWDALTFELATRPRDSGAQWGPPKRLTLVPGSELSKGVRG